MIKGIYMSIRFAPSLLGLCAAVCIITNGLSHAYETDSNCDEVKNSRFTFSWPITDDCRGKPRGGTSKGADVEFATEPRKEWLALQESGLSKYEKDRRAILAMQGGYKVNFDFLETVGYSADYQQDRPYQSWGTEFVYVIEDKPDFISLQHLMVMYFKQEDGSVSEPMVMKHWRQDWTFEGRTLLEYFHNNTWKKRKLKKRDIKGQWSQAVFQVDDSPRYESYGEWRHNSSFSTWISQTTRRPLPRRERSVRDDYHVLEGFNRHTVTQLGWVQEEENWKLVLDDQGRPDAVTPYIAKEEGLARYQVVTNFDFSAGDEYMQKTAPVWATVRDQWRNLIDNKKSISLKKHVDGQPMFMPLFSLANQYAEERMNEQQANEKISQTIKNYLKQ